ncbi:MAG TPA: ring-cleaving dioxygenase [Candidatus Acidoferrales bacterium]|nr:ring-cleaving dioxygenase [Candidatus Acidoferrales bacterium]
MKDQIAGIHHVTAVTGAAGQNVRFYTEVLGLRLVKKTVNQDDVSAYHLFYGDAVGTPGTELTFFDWPQSPAARPGATTIAPIALSVADEHGLNWWSDRFRSLGVRSGPAKEEDGHLRLPFLDPEGQRLELVADGSAIETVGWEQSTVPEAVSIRGFNDVTVTSAQPEMTLRMLAEVMGFEITSERELPDGGGQITVFGTGRGGAGSRVRVVSPGGVEVGAVGIGGVHHVAFRAADDDEQGRWRTHLLAAGLRVTPVIDRYYFHSIYFREPGGALFEIATDGPGFTADEDEAQLGTHLALPPFLEPERARIEAGLQPISI